MLPLFVVGCHRSGTTLVRRILSSHPEVWLAKETQYLAWLRLAPGDWDQPRTPEQIAQHIDWAHGFLRGTGWTALPEPAAFAASGEPPTWAGVYRWICRSEAPPDRALAVWGDNTPRYVSLIPELAAGFPDARFVHVVRDPRDVVASALKVWFGGNTALTAAEEWIERVGAGLAAAQLLGDRVLLVRFEDLLRDPATALARIGAHLGVPADGFRPDDLGGDAATVARQAHLANVGRPLDPAVIGQHRTALTAAQLADVEQLTQPFLRCLGYDSDVWHPTWDPTPRFARYARGYAQSLAVNLARGARRRLLG